MQGARNRLVPVGEAPVPQLVSEEEEPAAPSRRIDDGLTYLLVTSLKALSQRALVALASLVDLALIGSAFALWVMVIATPTVLQLVGVAGYAVFVLIALWLRKRPLSL